MLLKWVYHLPLLIQKELAKLRQKWKGFFMDTQWMPSPKAPLEDTLHGVAAPRNLPGPYRNDTTKCVPFPSLWIGSPSIFTFRCNQSRIEMPDSTKPSLEFSKINTTTTCFIDYILVRSGCPKRHNRDKWTFRCSHVNIAEHLASCSSNSAESWRSSLSIESHHKFWQLSSSFLCSLIPVAVVQNLCIVRLKMILVKFIMWHRHRSSLKRHL